MNNIIHCAVPDNICRVRTQIWRIMRLSFIFIFAALMQVSASSLAQKITLSEKNTPLEQVLKKIRLQTGYDFLYGDKVLSGAKKININVSDAQLVAVLDQIFEEQPLTYSIQEKVVIVKPKEPSFLDNIIARFADIDVRGRVVDEQSNPLPNASIQVKGKAKVYNSNDKGEFSIPDVADDAVLLVSYVGFKTLEISLKDAVMPLEIKLNVATGELEEVNVEYNTGYQNIPKERATGSFVQIDNDLINRSVSTNILDRLGGVASGVNLNPGPRSPSIKNQSNFTIRGISTINANSNPLVVVDGFPYEEATPFIGGNNIINNLNPNDVESVTLLKDAAAASIWGARAGNGVIVITTKKGRYNQTSKIAFNSSVTIGDKPDLFYLNRISAKDAIDFEKRRFADSVYNVNDDSYPKSNSFPVISPVAEILLAARRGEITKSAADTQLKAMEALDIRNDVSKYLQQKSVNQQYQLNLSGGSEKFNYYGSIGYDRNSTNYIGDKYQRLTIRYDNTYRLFKNLEINGFINYVQSSATNNSNVGFNLDSAAPYSRLADDFGQALPYYSTSSTIRKAYIDTAKYAGLQDWSYRPLNELGLNDRANKKADNRFGFGIKYSVIPSLSMEIKYQYQKILGNERNYYDPKSYTVRDMVNSFMQIATNGVISYPVPNSGILDQTLENVISNNIRAQLNYNKIWNNDHGLTVVAGAEVKEITSEFSGDRKYGYDIINGTVNLNIDYLTRYITRPSRNTSNISNRDNIGEITNRYLSYFGNAAYTLKNRYVLSLSGRMDGSNFFGIKTNQKIKPLWSLGGSWDITKEPFYKLSWLPAFRLRATYGYQGNIYNNVTAYPTIRYGGGTNPYGFPAASVVTPGNPQLRWETIRMTNVGLDFGFKNNRISGTIEYYIKRGEDLIGDILTDPTTGFFSFIGNRASISGKGMDMTINSQNTIGEVKWHTNFILGYNTDKVTHFENAPGLLGQSFIDGSPMEGKPLYSIFSYRWAGLNPLNGDPRAYVADTVASFQVVNASASPKDLIFHGSATPKYFGALRNTFSYNQFSLSFNITYKFDYYIRRSSISYTDLISKWNGHSDYGVRWQQPGDELKTNIPSLTTINPGPKDNVYRRSNILVDKGDHIRLQDIRLSYSLNKNKHKYIFFQNLSVFAYASNVGILWRANNHHIDPDYGDNAVPPSRTVALGLNVNF